MAAPHGATIGIGTQSSASYSTDGALKKVALGPQPAEHGGLLLALVNTDMNRNVF